MTGFEIESLEKINTVLEVNVIKTVDDFCNGLKFAVDGQRQ